MRILIIDDQKRQIDYLEELIKSHLPEVEILGKFQNPIEALKYVKTNVVDLILLDIEMPEMTGFEFLEILGLDAAPAIIFTTAYSKYAVEAFKVNAIDYLLKPIDPDELVSGVNKVRQNQNNNSTVSLESILQSPPISFDNRIVITEGQTYTFIPFEEIIRVQGSGSYATFYLLNDTKKMTSKRLNIHWKRLENNGFIRPHQSHVVNLKHIISYNKEDGGTLFLKNDFYVPVSPNLKTEVKKILGL